MSIQAQDQPKTFIGGGVSLNRTSSPDPDPTKSGDGGKVYFGAYGEAGLAHPKGFQARLLVEYTRFPQLPTIFTLDEASTRTATSEVRFRPELRLNLFKNEAFQPFVSGGLEMFRQFFEDQETHSYGSYSRPLQAFGINPLLGAGVQVGSNEIQYTYLFTDKSAFNSSYLNGHRLGYSYTHKVSNRLSLKASGEADYVTFRESDGRYHDYYREKDVIFKGRIGFIFHSKEK